MNTNQLKRASFFSIVAVLFSLLVAGCGGSSDTSSSTTVAITITPTSVTLPAGASQQFTATVTGSTNTAVTWQVNSVTGGSAAFGTISTAGLYTAPTSLPSSAITVTAIAQADTTKTVTAAVSVTLSTRLIINPTSATLAAGGQQTFTATLGGLSAATVWSVSCQSPVTGGCGTMSSTGIYTAPLSPPPGGSVTVTASSQNNTANPATAGVTVTFGSGTLVGQYSFSMTGRSGGQPFREVGSITFDGKGGITGGVEDQFASATTKKITGGSYVSGSDGRVTATVHTDSGDEVWQITAVDHTHALVMRADSVTARGDLDLQNSSQFGRSLSGTFVISLSGEKPTASTPASAAVGSISADGQGNITSGILDVNDGGTVSANLALNGSCQATASDTGRGTLTLSSSLGTQTFAYYIVSSSFAKFIEIDGIHNLGGEIAQGPNGPISAGFYAASYAFVFSGANTAGNVGQGGTFVVDSTGNVSNGTFDLSTDSAFALGFLFSGAFALADPSTGRATATFNVSGTTLQYVLYPTANRKLAFLEIDNKHLTSGVALTQSSPVNGVSIVSLTGQFALAANESGGVVRAITGAVVPASATTGTLDVNDAGSVTLGNTLQSSSFTVTSLSGRSTLNLQAGTYKAGYSGYLVDANNVLLLQTDGKGVLSGVMQKQF